MLGFDKFFENKTLMFSAGAVAFLVAAILILFIIRLVFGRRLHMPGGGRARQPRLGVVDAFDLDRQRQLVLVRRDNVEHLIMIGGPNDVLIESQIVRVEARETLRPREKEPAAAPLTWPGGAGQTVSVQPTIAADPKLPFPQPVSVAIEPVPVPANQAPSVPAASVPAAGAVVTPAPGSVEPPPATPGAVPPKRAPFPPLPPRRTTPPPSFGGLKPAMPPAPGLSAADATAPGLPKAGLPIPGLPVPNLPVPGLFVQGTEPSQSPAAPAPFPQRTGGTPPAFLRPPLRPLNPITPPTVTPPSPDETFPSAAPAVVTPKPVEPERTEQELKPADALESLEEEMAKLLGRGTKDQI